MLAGARYAFLGKLGEQFEKNTQDPVAVGLGIVLHTIEPRIAIRLWRFNATV